MTPLTKRLTVALAISVALNLLLAGFFLGRALERRHKRGFDRAVAGAHGPRMMRDEGLRAFLKESKIDFQTRREATRAARGSVKAALEREPFDKVALEQSFAGLRAETARSQEELHKALVDAAAKADPDKRRRLAEAFARDRRGKR